MNKIMVVILSLFLVACTPLDLLNGGGPNVAANVQAGKENTQQVVANQTEVGRDYKQGSVDAQNVEKITIQQTPIWMIVLLVLGWLLPSPNEIARGIRSLFKK